MQVKLLTPTEFVKVMEYNAAYAMLTCHANTEKLQDEKPRVFIEKAIKAGHKSILEHITLTYEVNNLSRACLQELARHRHISLSVESTRHTLKNVTGNPDSIKHIYDIVPQKFRETLRITLNFICRNSVLPNDELKYYVPEFWPTNLVMTANVRELRHIMKLRTAPAALMEFQDLARNFAEVLPDEFKYLLEDCVYKGGE